MFFLIVSCLVFISVDGLLIRGRRDIPSGSLYNGQDLRLHELHETTSWPFLESCYNSHNDVRRQHEVPELKLNRTLVDYARLKALILAWYDGDAPQEKDPNMFGENDYWSKSEDVECSEAVASWTSESKNWDYDKPQLNDDNRHYAQVVWRGTRKFGCGQALSRGPKGGTYTVCYYDPTAAAGRESTNVFRPRPAEEPGAESSP